MSKRIALCGGIAYMLQQIDCLHKLRHLFVRQQASRLAVELVVIMSQTLGLQFLAESRRVHQNGHIIIGTAFYGSQYMIRHDYRYLIRSKNHFLHVIQCPRHTRMIDTHHNTGRDHIPAIYRKTVHIAQYRHFSSIDSPVHIFKYTSFFHKKHHFGAQNYCFFLTYARAF